MPRLVLIVLLITAALDVRAEAGAPSPPGEWIQFLGWRADSRAYAYRVTSLSYDRKGRLERRSEDRLVTIPRRGEATVRRYGGSIERRLAHGSYGGDPLPTTRPEPGVVRFFTPDGRVLRFRVVVGGRLGYELALERDGATELIGAGVFDDLYAKTDAFAYLSPDGRKVALIVYGETPYRVRGEVHLMRLPRASAEAPRVKELPTTAGAPDVREPTDTETTQDAVADTPSTAAESDADDGEQRDAAPE